MGESELEAQLSIQRDEQWINFQRKVINLLNTFITSIPTF